MSNHTVLVVDDEFSVRRLLARLLRKRGLQVITADSVATAEMLLLYNEVDLIICDHQMPGENGISFLTRLKKQFPEMVRCLITGYADFALTMKATNDAEVAYCITKPFEPSELQDLVSDLLSWGERREAGPGRAFTQQQRADINRLAEHHPGIADVRRDTQGAILVQNDLDEDGGWSNVTDGDSGDATDAGVILFGDEFARILGV